MHAEQTTMKKDMLGETRLTCSPMLLTMACIFPLQPQLRLDCGTRFLGDTIELPRTMKPDAFRTVRIVNRRETYFALDRRPLGIKRSVHDRLLLLRPEVDIGFVSQLFLPRRLDFFFVPLDDRSSSSIGSSGQLSIVGSVENPVARAIGEGTSSSLGGPTSRS